MADPHDRDREDAGGRHERTSFNQQGQHIHGPQYNADQINFGEFISPDVIAEGLRRDRERRRREREAAARLQETIGRIKDEAAAWARRQEELRQREERDLELYGYRYYTRDRERWLQSLTPEERWDEERRERERIKRGKLPWDRHRKILRTGELPPDTSPADPRYLQAKKEFERKEKKRERRYGILGLLSVCAIILIAITDGALWMLVIMGVGGMVGLMNAIIKR